MSVGEVSRGEINDGAVNNVAVSNNAVSNTVDAADAADAAELTRPWQPVMAALADPLVMRVYAEAVLGQANADPSAADRKARLRLSGLGLLEPGTNKPVPNVLKRVLIANSVPKLEGVDKFFKDGYLTHLPMAGPTRIELLEKLSRRLFVVDEKLSEAQVNRLLRTVTSDIPTLRRALIDFGFLDRAHDGSVYWLNATGAIEPA